MATDRDAGLNGSLSYTILTSHLYRGGSNISSGSVVPNPFAISETGKLTTATLVAEYNQERFKLEVIAKERAAPFREAKAFVNVRLKFLSTIFFGYLICYFCLLLTFCSSSKVFHSKQESSQYL